MRLDRIMIAAPGSGSGKTTVTCALLQALKDAGRRAAACKCGPDYIDPMFHKKVIGVPSQNLDTFFTGEEETKRLFLKNRRGDEFVVLEGVMGLFDGLGGIREEGSSYHLARITKTPVVLVIDTKGMARSAVPLAAGFLKYDREHLVKGIIFNRMSGASYERIKPLAEKELGIQIMGYLPEDPQFHIGSRHLGLVLPDELQGLKGQLQAAAEKLCRTVPLEGIKRVAEEAEELEAGGGHMESEKAAGREKAPVIAVAEDEAFCFYYEENLLLLQEYGAVTASFSPLHDTKLPEGCSGILLGGGYPELYAEELSRNTEMLAQIKDAAEQGMPIVAECGGFLYLHAMLENQDGKSYPMAGVLPGTCRYAGKPVRFGYLELEEKKSRFLPEGGKIRGHEFHYFDSEDNGSGCLAVKPVTGKSYPCVAASENCWMGFPHLYYPSCPAFARNFVEKAERYRKG